LTQKKPHLLTKACAVCGRPFVWRRRWVRCWAEERYRSEACRRWRPRRSGAD
jgi:hypothetical protein